MNFEIVLNAKTSLCKKNIWSPGEKKPVWSTFRSMHYIHLKIACKFKFIIHLSHRWIRCKKSKARQCYCFFIFPASKMVAVSNSSPSPKCSSSTWVFFFNNKKYTVLSRNSTLVSCFKSICPMILLRLHLFNMLSQHVLNSRNSYSSLVLSPFNHYYFVSEIILSLIPKSSWSQ